MLASVWRCLMCLSLLLLGHHANQQNTQLQPNTADKSNGANNSKQEQQACKTQLLGKPWGLLQPYPSAREHLFCLLP